MTWGLKIALDDMACTDLILPNFNLDIATAIMSVLCIDMYSRKLQYYHACMFNSGLWHAQASLSFRGCSLHVLGLQLD